MNLGSNKVISDLLHKILNEEEGSEIGRITLTRKLTEELVVHVCRFIFTSPDLTVNVESWNFYWTKAYKYHPVYSGKS
ncbi:MAG: hypothetical protein IPL22_02080 [Bacteroidetes bacterium]|nr:hypothetical protein [Bacteroidota bacterium]